MSIMIYIKIKNCKIKFSMDPVMLPLMLSPPTPKKPLTSKLDSRIVIEMNKYWTHKKDGRQKTSREQDLIKFFFFNCRHFEYTSAAGIAPLLITRHRCLHLVKTCFRFALMSSLYVGGFIYLIH